MSAIADSNSTYLDQLDSIGDATAEQHAAIRAAIEAAGGHDVLPYFFGVPLTEGERKRIRNKTARERYAAKRAATTHPEEES